jgi:hypothetical protein
VALIHFDGRTVTALALTCSIVAGCSGAGDPAASPQKTPPGAADAADSPKGPDSVAIDRRADEEAREQFGKIKGDVVNALGPGGDQSQVNLGRGVTFTSVPLEKLRSFPIAESDVRVIDKLSEGGRSTRVFPILHQDRVFSSICFSWDQPGELIRPEQWDAGKSSVFAKQIEEAKRRYAKATGTPLGEYEGVSFSGLNEHFLVIEQNGEEKLIPLERDPDRGFVPGRAMSAPEVVRILKGMAETRAATDAPG